MVNTHIISHDIKSNPQTEAGFEALSGAMTEGVFAPSGLETLLVARPRGFIGCFGTWRTARKSSKKMKVLMKN